MTEIKTYPGLIRKSVIKASEGTFSHSWNSNSEVTGTHMSRLAGLKRTGVSLVRIAPGKESFAYHLHHREEEWIYVISGRGVAQIDGNEYSLAAGDFVAFPTPSVPHNLTNPFDAELVYLMGGENRAREIADFPTLGKRMVKLSGEETICDLSDGKPFV
jgi:uncharacterized cupin superfamily protein